MSWDESRFRKNFSIAEFWSKWVEGFKSVKNQVTFYLSRSNILSPEIRNFNPQIALKFLFAIGSLVIFLIKILINFEKIFFRELSCHIKVQSKNLFIVAQIIKWKVNNTSVSLNQLKKRNRFAKKLKINFALRTILRFVLELFSLFFFVSSDHKKF